MAVMFCIESASYGDITISTTESYTFGAQLTTQ